MGKQSNETTENTSSPSSAIITDLQKNLGIDVGDIVKDLAKDYAKESLFGKKGPVSGRTKFSKALDGISDFVRGVWWVPGAVYLLLGIAIVSIKVLEKLAGV